MPTDRQLSDEQIVANVIAGDTQAYSVLIERYNGKLTRYVRFLIHDIDTSDDVVQDTFIKAYRNLNNFNHRYPFSPWLYRIAHNEAMNMVRRYRREIPLTSEDDSTEYASDVSVAIKKIDADILRHDVQSCLRQLPPKQKSVIHLIYFEGMSYAEAGAIMKAPVSTIGVWVGRAKMKLKKICAEKEVNL